MKVLITGGAGYIGSTIAACCADNSITPIILDNLTTGLAQFGERYAFYRGDFSDERLLDQVFSEHPDIEVVIHCAASIIVPESVAQPLDYYRNNVSRTIEFLQYLKRIGVSRFLLSSTASMYEPGADFMVDEHSIVDPQSPYSASKWMVERVLRDAAAAGDIQAIALRYLNPIGADPQMRSGMQISDPTHVLGKLISARSEGRPFTVTGVDWPTRDGSGLRDYVHVWDLARAHVAALARFDDIIAGERDAVGYSVINLGTGTGTTVFELLQAFDRATESHLEVVTAPPRPGDVVGCASRIDKARSVLGWSPELTTEQAIRHSLEWSSRLPAVLELEALSR